MYEELPEIGKNLITNPEEKWAKNMKQNFTEKKKKSSSPSTNEKVVKFACGKRKESKIYRENMASGNGHTHVLLEGVSQPSAHGRQFGHIFQNYKSICSLTQQSHFQNLMLQINQHVCIMAWRR